MRRLRNVLRVILVLLVVLALWSLVRASTPVTAFRRQIVVNVPREVAWEHFNKLSEWKTWLGDSGAPTMLSTNVAGPETVATFAGNLTFRMSQFEPTSHWMWTGKMGWLTIDYNHIFEPISAQQTRIVFHQTVRGFGNDASALLLRGLTAAVGHQAALNRLADEMNRLPAATAR